MKKINLEKRIEYYRHNNELSEEIKELIKEAEKDFNETYDKLNKSF